MPDLTPQLLAVLEETGATASVQGRFRAYVAALERVIPIAGCYFMLFDWDHFTPVDGTADITLGDPVAATPPPQHFFHAGYDLQLMTAYGDKYIHHDTAVTRCMQEVGRVFREDDVYAEEEWETNPFLRDFFVPRMGFRYALAGILEISVERLLAWGIYRRPGEVPFTVEQREICQALAPHLSRLVYEALLGEAAAGCLPPVLRPRCTLRLRDDGGVEGVVAGGETFWAWIREQRGGERDRVLVEPASADHASAVALERLSDRSWIRLEVARGPEERLLALVDLVPGGSRQYVQAEGAHLGLTRRELEVAVLALRGRSNKQIAGELSSSAQTVKHQLASVYAKTGADGRAALARLLMGPPEVPSGA